MFLMRALEKILADKELKRSQHSQLKKACESALGNTFAHSIGLILLSTNGFNNKDEFKKELKSQGVESMQPTANTEKYFLPFEYACKSKSPRIMETSLDCIQKLIAHGYIMADEKNLQLNQQLINRITRVICNCFEGPHIEDAVQLQIIKVGFFENLI